MSDVAPYALEVRYDTHIPVRDGLELSANLFMPVARAAGERFPAILEMIPYRKDDWRYCFDHQLMTYFAQRGYAGCRLDVRGTGSSPGLARDEYTPEETQDGYDAVEWLAAQPWCNGNVGMWGISYGGFTAIQVAMLRPPALKAIVPVYATDDRYTDDVHYNGGCLTASELAQYAVSMVAMNAMPPDVEYARGDWAARWKERLELTPWLIEWLLTVEVYGGDTSKLPDGRSLFNAERLLLTAYEHDPAHVVFANQVDYRLDQHGYETRIRSTGTIRSTATDFHVDIQLRVDLNGNPFFQKSWLESIPRVLL